MEGGFGIDLYMDGITNPLIIIMEHYANLHKSSIRYAKISLKVNTALRLEAKATC